MTDLVRSLFFLLCNCSSFFFVQAILFPCRPSDPCGCSRNHVDVNFRLAGGEIVAHRSWAWAVSVRDVFDMHICGGTIISKSFVLTAAHCFRKISGRYLPYSVLMGVDSLNSTRGHVRMVSDIFIHPKWNVTTQENDIAILRLHMPSPLNDNNIARICLPHLISSERVQYPILRSLLVAIGWGITTWEDFITPMYLRQVSLEAIDSAELNCNRLIRNLHLQFCAALKGGGKDTCQGDSGGPIMSFSSKRRRWILAGIISYGYRCALRDYTGVYTRISVYIDWIKAVVGTDGIVTVEESSACSRPFSNLTILLSLSSVAFLYFAHVYLL